MNYLDAYKMMYKVAEDKLPETPTADTPATTPAAPAKTTPPTTTQTAPAKKPEISWNQYLWDPEVWTQHFGPGVSQFLQNHYGAASLGLLGTLLFGGLGGIGDGRRGATIGGLLGLGTGALAGHYFDQSTDPANKLQNRIGTYFNSKPSK